jgi:hypothetical protein
VRWIDPLMKHQGIDYRMSLLRAGAFSRLHQPGDDGFSSRRAKAAPELRAWPTSPAVHPSGSARLRRSQPIRMARALRKAKSLKPLDPAATPLVAALGSPQEKNANWMLLINEHVEIDP